MEKRFCAAEIFPFQPADLEAVAALEEKLFSSPWSPDDFTQLLRQSAFRMRVAKWEERVVGYYAAQQVAGEAELHNLAVAPDFQGRGVGRLLLNHFIMESEKWGVSKGFLLVRKSNIKALNLYAGFGFRFCGKRPGFYDNPREDAWVLHKNLDPAQKTG